MEKIRVLHVGTRLTNNGGIEKNFINLYRAIDRRRIQFDVVVVEENKQQYFEEEVITSGGIIHSIPGRDKQFFRSIIERFKVYKKYKKYGVIHIHVSRGIRSLDGVIARLCGIKTVIFHSHTNLGNIRFKHKLARLLFRLTGDYYLACSLEAGRYFFGDNIIESDKFYIAKNAIDLKEFTFSPIKRERIREELNLNDKSLIGYVGRFSVEKNIEFMIDVFDEISHHSSKAFLLLVGSGELESKLRARIDELGLTNKVLFTGPRSDIADVMSALDVLILPSLYEGLGLVLIEAQAVGLKCFASDNIPDESRVTEQIKYLSLSLSPKVWAEEILNELDGYNRSDNHILIKNAGYDITSTVKTIQKLYLNHL